MNPLQQLPIMEEFVHRWLEELRRREYSPRSIQSYDAVFKNLKTFLGSQKLSTLTAIRPEHLTAWQQSLLGCRPATRVMFTRVVRSFFAWLVLKGHLFASPARGLIVEQFESPLGRCPSEDEMARVIDHIVGRDIISRRDRAILEIAYGTGARLEELVLLNLRSIDPVNRVVRLHGKGNKERSVPMTTAALKAVEAYRRVRSPSDSPAPEALFLSQRSGRRLGAHAVAGVIRRRGSVVNLKLAPHDIRRAFATHLRRGGCSPAMLRQLLGHATYRHLDRYLLLHPTHAIQAARKTRINR